jgi:hypothetical protein
MNRLLAGGVALVSVLAGKAAIACRLRRRPEGWRRTVGILLRSEPTRFAVSGFGLHVPGAVASDTPAHIQHLAAAALQRYLASTPDAHFRLDWRPAVTIRRRTRTVDVVLLDFAGDGQLRRLVPFLAEADAVRVADERRERAHHAILAAYDVTRRLPELDRPSAIASAVERALAAEGQPVLDYARRLLAATCVSFETIDLDDPAARFRPPCFQGRRSLGFGFLTFVMRRQAGVDLDVWASAHHVGLDGVPLQELVSGLERAWGTSEAPAFPAADAERAFMPPRVCSVGGERPVDEMLAFVDFSPVAALRRAVNARFGARLREPATFGAVLAWLIEREPEFSGVRIASTVDIAASGGYDRDVDVVPLRPADYARAGGEWDGFIDFANEFNRLIALSRERRSPLRDGMSTAGLLPAAVHSHIVRSNPAALDETFGSLCITIIRDAKVFVAPMTDLGLGHGFFAIGSTNLRAVDGRRVAAVSIKGDAGRIAGHHAALQRAIAHAAALAASVMHTSES